MRGVADRQKVKEQNKDKNSPSIWKNRAGKILST